jgi:hypothetical protein
MHLIFLTNVQTVSTKNILKIGLFWQVWSIFKPPKGRRGKSSENFNLFEKNWNSRDQQVKNVPL